MKYMKFLRILGIAVILSLLMAAIPAVPALAVRTFALNPSQGKVGASITATGQYFYRTTDTAIRYVNLYFSSDVPPTGTYFINNQITHFVRLFEGIEISDGDGTNLETGSFSYTFTVPSTIGTNAVAPGTNYYVYVSQEYTVPFSETDQAPVRTYSSFTIIPGPSLDALTPNSGPVGTPVTISGSNFDANSAIVIKYDGTEILKTGDTQTRSSGIFISTITIPPSTAGAHTITVTVGTTTVTAQFTVTASATLNSLLPATGPAGTDVTVSGANFLVSYPIIFKFDNITILPKSGDVNTSTTGSFVSIITIPQSTVAVHTVTVTVGSATTTANFTVTASAPPPTPTTNTTAPPPPPPTPPPTTANTTLSLSQTSGNIGTNIMVGGAGLKPNATITIKYDDKDVTSAPATDSGMFLAVFQVPPSQHGDHTITASDGANTQKRTFTVESIAPKAPQPLMPEMGVKVKSPMTFKWEEVTDNSSPVTYALQIATDEDFPEKSILLEKTEITKLQYILTKNEESDLKGNDTPYYWRVQAIDAAQNESEWTGAGEFFISTGFKLTGWPLYAALGVGAVLLFLIGFLLGRRTAFYY